MTEVTDEYVASRYEYAKKRIGEAQDVLDAMKLASISGTPSIVPRDAYLTLLSAFGAVREIAYGLDEAMAVLKEYADPQFWTEVPEKTYAASDRGQKARVALARINPV